MLKKSKPQNPNNKSEILNSKQILNPSRTEIKISSGIPLLRENPNVPNQRFGIWKIGI
jgi:hypothetical protein